MEQKPLRLCLHVTDSTRIRMDPVRKSDRIGLLITQDLSGTRCGTDPNGSQTGPAVLQVQFWIRSGPVPEWSRVSTWIGSKRFFVNRTRSGPVLCKHSLKQTNEIASIQQSAFKTRGPFLETPDNVPISCAQYFPIIPLFEKRAPDVRKTNSVSGKSRKRRY